MFNNNCRLFVHDRSTNQKFLIDTGSDLSIISASNSEKKKQSNDFKLFAANGTPIATFGQKLITVNLGLRRNFTWAFIIANVTRPIIGADFLRNFELLVDLKNKKLIDGKTNLKITAQVELITDQNINITSVVGEGIYDQLLNEFNDITKPDFNTMLSKKTNYFIASKLKGRLSSQKLGGYHPINSK